MVQISVLEFQNLVNRLGERLLDAIIQHKSVKKIKDEILCLIKKEKSEKILSLLNSLYTIITKNIEKVKNKVFLSIPYNFNLTLYIMDNQGHIILPITIQLRGNNISLSPLNLTSHFNSLIQGNNVLSNYDFTYLVQEKAKKKDTTWSTINIGNTVFSARYTPATIGSQTITIDNALSTDTLLSSTTGNITGWFINLTQGSFTIVNPVLPNNYPSNTFITFSFCG
jgi:hypothetical protein